MEYLKTKLSITRQSSTVGEGKIVITIEDANSGIRFIETKVDYENFAQAITGLSCVDSESCFNKNAHNYIGKKLETKKEILKGLKYENWCDRDKIISIYEIDGWVADKQKRHNHHCQKSDGYEYVFRRWV